MIRPVFMNNNAQMPRLDVCSLRLNSVTPTQHLMRKLWGLQWWPALTSVTPWHVVWCCPQAPQRVKCFLCCHRCCFADCNDTEASRSWWYVFKLWVLFDFPRLHSEGFTLWNFLISRTHLVCVARHRFTGQLTSEMYDAACHTDDLSLQMGSYTQLIFYKVSGFSLCSLN